MIRLRIFLLVIFAGVSALASFAYPYTRKESGYDGASWIRLVVILSLVVGILIYDHYKNKKKKGKKRNSNVIGAPGLSDTESDSDDDSDDDSDADFDFDFDD